ncbi:MULTISPECIES: hypothetical protein [unclassified Bartonella]
MISEPHEKNKISRLGVLDQGCRQAQPLKCCIDLKEQGLLVLSLNAGLMS